MLYVFIVSSGGMVKFDMNLAVKKVLELKTEIEKSLHIRIEDQVLLCSGGEELKSDNIVGNYSGAGTDTNPIFLFNKDSNDAGLAHDVPKFSFDMSIEDDVNNCANMAPSSNTAAVRATLAQRFAEAALSGRRKCDELVHGQHLQQQGWAAVIANLDDAKEALLKQKQHFEDLYEKYMTNRSCYEETLKTFPTDIELLSRIPLLPKLIFEGESFEEEVETEHTLLSWFCSEPLSVLLTLTEKYQRSLDELNEHTLAALNEDISVVLKKTNNSDIKEVKGIEKRLSELNKQIEDAKKIEKDQSNLASWFSHTQTRMTRDPVVLPDLCGTFQKQLLLMLDNHKSLNEILDRCTRAKNELSENINCRIKYISRVESEMYDLQVRIVFLEKHVVSVMKQYDSFHQVHLAPQRYFKLLAEVCRRRTFSSSFMKWATELSSQAFKLYRKEVSIRKDFVDTKTKNMVDNLFPGMEDVPPAFAIECPEPFDQNLPSIAREDLDILRLKFPDLAHFCEVMAPDPMPYISQAESDSAFSSNIPSSRIVGDSVHSGGKGQTDKEQISPFKLPPPSGRDELCSLPSEYASMPNEVFSLASSPFEDPLLLNNELGLTLKHVKSDLPASNRLFPESDGEEFETFDCFGPAVVQKSDVCIRKKSVGSSAPRPNSTSDVISISKSLSDKQHLRMSKAQSDGDAVSPISERLRHSESILVSGDFQSTEYYIDDSMPSSYTESNATSPLLRSGNRMVKSHHIVVAELQKQVQERTSELVGAASSPRNSCSNILKLHAQISALQKFICELKGSFQNELSDLKKYVKEEFWERMSEMATTVGTINSALADLQTQIEREKEEAVISSKNVADLLVNTYSKRLEVESQKLNDAETQIANYEEHLQQLSINFEELKHENEQLSLELTSKKELITKMMLEHELELESIRNQTKQDVHSKNDEVYQLKQVLGEKHKEIEILGQANKTLEAELCNQQAVEKENMVELLKQKEAEFSERLNNDLKQLQEEIRLLQDRQHAQTVANETSQRLTSEKELNLEQAIQQLRKEKETELSDLEVRLTAQHKAEMDSLRSRYKLAMTTSTIEKPGSPVQSDNEGIAEDLRRVIEEKRKKWEEEKDECLNKMLLEQEEKLKNAVAHAIQQESIKYEEEKSLLQASLSMEHQEYVKKLQSQQMADVQVSFNEAINSVTKEKESIIESLRLKSETLESQVTMLEQKLMSIQSCLQKYTSAGSTDDSSRLQLNLGATSTSSPDEVSILEKLKAEVAPYLQLTLQASCSFCVEDLKHGDQLKKVKSLDKGDHSFDCAFKISILSCDVGDLILLCYEEKHESFVVFHFGQFVHFLHSDSLQQLNLKIPAGPSEKWALGIVTFKEFCVTRKPSNRYKINLGAKFYRVKVKLWDKEKAVRDYVAARRSASNLPSPQDGAKGMSSSSI